MSGKVGMVTVATLLLVSVVPSTVEAAVCKGSRVTALGFPSLSGRPIMALIAFTFEDGREVRGNMDRYLRASEVD